MAADPPPYPAACAFAGGDVADAPSRDAAPPGLATRLPARARRVIRVPVRCSEACDAVMRLTAHGRSVQTGGLLGAGVTRTLRLAVPRRFRGRARLAVLVADRAGNVARRGRAIRLTGHPSRGAKAASAGHR